MAASTYDGLFVAESFTFSSGERMDVRLAYQTLGILAPAHGNAVLLLQGMTGSGRQFLQPAFAGAMFDPGGQLDARSIFVILPDAIGHEGSSKPSDGLERSFPATATPTWSRRNTTLWPRDWDCSGCA